MTGSDISFWLWWLLAVPIAFVSGMLIHRTIRGDRAGDRRRCPRCWYDMSGGESLRCSECGHVARREKNLFRTRRRWRLLPLAVVILIPHALSMVRAHLGPGWWVGMMSDRMLVTALPFLADMSSPPGVELVDRLNARLLDDEEWSALFDRCIQGDAGARPPSPEWENKYGVILATWRSQYASRPDLVSRLLDLPPRTEITAPHLVLAGKPASVFLDLWDWWPAGSEARVRIAPLLPGATSILLQQTRARGAPRGRSIDLPALDVDTKNVSFEVTVERRNADLGAPWRTIVQETVTTPIDLIAPEDDDLPPVQSPEMDAIMRTVFDGRVARFTPRRHRHGLTFYVRAGYTQSPLLDGVAIGVVADLLRDEEVVDSIRIWWPAGVDLPRRIVTYERVTPRPDLIPEVTTGDDRWRVRVKSDRGLAYRVFGAIGYWEGEFTMPVQVIESDRRGGTIGWIVVDEEAVTDD